MTIKTAFKLHQQTLKRVHWSAASMSVRMCHKLVIQERIRRQILNECFGHKNFNFWTFGGKLRQRTRRVPDVISPRFASISCTWQKQSEKKLNRRLKLTRGENAVFSKIWQSCMTIPDMMLPNCASTLRGLRWLFCCISGKYCSYADSGGYFPHSESGISNLSEREVRFFWVGMGLQTAPSPFIPPCLLLASSLFPCLCSCFLLFTLQGRAP